jgi:hypothetical protein
MTSRISSVKILELTFLLWSLLMLSVQAEPSWLKAAIDSIPTTPPHKDATTLCLYRSDETKIKENGRAISHIRLATKILKSTGIQDAYLRQPVMSQGEVKNLEGWLIRSDGKKGSLTDKDVVRISASQAAGYYDDAIVLGAALPEAAEGSIVAYEYDVDESSPWGVFFQHFTFQIQQPVLFAQFSLELPDGWSVQGGSATALSVTINRAAIDMSGPLGTLRSSPMNRWRRTGSCRPGVSAQIVLGSLKGRPSASRTGRLPPCGWRVSWIHRPVQIRL